MKTVTIKDKTFELSIEYAKIQEAIISVAKEINRDYIGMEPLFLVVLNGAFMFAGELMKEIDLPCEISFVKLASYAGTQSTSHVKKLIGLNEEIKGRNVVVVEDIVDSGITMEKLLEELAAMKPRSISIATLLLKPDALVKDIEIDYVGMEIPNEFIVGFGLDYDGYGRNLKDIYKIVV
ncbi:MAG: hypoxanthine phosphoribosyltransferase [Bacteroidota bacterium]